MTEKLSESPEAVQEANRLMNDDCEQLDSTELREAMADLHKERLVEIVTNLTVIRTTLMNTRFAVRKVKNSESMLGNAARTDIPIAEINAVFLDLMDSMDDAVELLSA